MKRGVSVQFLLQRNVLYSYSIFRLSLYLPLIATKKSLLCMITSLFLISSDSLSHQPHETRHKLFSHVYDSTEEELLEMHKAQFDKFIGSLDPHFSQTLQEWQPEMQKFEAKTINATILSFRGFIREFVIGSAHCGNFDLPYAPPTMHSLCVTKCWQWYTIETRLLPRCLEIFDYSRNRIHGKFDMSTLPEKIFSVNLSHNYISGPFSLVGLPETIQNIQMQMSYGNTRIGTLWYDKLPAALTTVDLMNTSVDCVRPLVLNYSVKQEGIFQCSKNTRIL